ncbi:MAG: phosphotransferase family protein [Gammaproteobacteria bacterium]|nr:phosphotransferase family protein [Gammaproteobacteria bacterium]
MQLDEVRHGLEAFIADEIGAQARLGSLAESDGHAGLTFLFEIVDGARTLPYVIKLPPRGVRRSGNTDVYRQAPLLRALHADGLPVPDVPWAWEHEDNPWFGLPFIIMERLPGHTFFVWDPAAGVSRDPADCERYWTDCVTTLARLHAFDWQRHLPDWEAPMELEREITRWERIYAQAPEPAWARAAAATERALLDSMPAALPFGLFHGDYQPGNCLYQDGSLVGVIDWELSGIGAQLLDLGWLLMVADAAIWTPGWMPVNPLPLARVRALYAAGRGEDFDHVDWFHALANYRLASIACLNVKLHRTGKRHDPIWEHNGRSVLPMYERALALVAGA